MNDKLTKISSAFDDWCSRRNVPYDIAIDEGDIQGYMIFKRHNYLIPRLVTALEPTIREQGIHLQHHVGRQGTVLAFSILPISESELTEYLPAELADQYITEIDKIIAGQATVSELEMPQKPPIAQPPTAKPVSKPGAQATTPLPKQQTGGPPKSKKQQYDVRDSQFGQRLTEALDGVGAEFQPEQVMGQIRQAIQKLGLAEKLKKAGITARLSQDGLYLHFYAPSEGQQGGREIVRHFIQELADPSKLEDALYQLIDVSYGRAPGAGKLEQEVRRQEEKNLSQVAKQFALANMQAQPEAGQAQAGQPAPTGQPAAAGQPAAGQQPTGPASGGGAPAPPKPKPTNPRVENLEQKLAAVLTDSAN